MKRIRVLFVDHTPFVGGAELVLRNHIRELTRQQFFSNLVIDPLVACSSVVPQLVEDYRAAGAKVFVIPFGHLKSLSPAIPWRFLRSVKALRAIIRRNGVDLIVTNTERAMYVGTVAAFLTRTKLIWWVRDFEYNRPLFRVLQPLPARIICVSRAIRDYYGGRADSKFVVSYVGSDFDKRLRNVKETDIERVRKELGLSSSCFVVGFVGRLVEWKGPQVLLKAAKILKHRIDDFKIVIVGSGSGQQGNIEPQLYQEIQKENLADSVILTGYRRDIPVLMKLFDIFCHTSIKPEPFATVVVEAMLSGLPVLGTSIGGTPEIIRNGHNGFLLPPGDARSLSRIILHLWRHQQLRSRLGLNAYHNARSRFTEELITRKVVKFYREVVL